MWMRGWGDLNDLNQNFACGCWFLSRTNEFLLLARPLLFPTVVLWMLAMAVCSTGFTLRVLRCVNIRQLVRARTQKKQLTCTNMKQKNKPKTNKQTRKITLHTYIAFWHRRWRQIHQRRSRAPSRPQVTTASSSVSLASSHRPRPSSSLRLREPVPRRPAAAAERHTG